MSARMEPIRDRRKIATIKKLLRDGSEIRSYVLFALGINLGLRIADLLKLTIKAHHFLPTYKPAPCLFFDIYFWY